jgi:DNA-binding Lrp family transcriptional regulator
MSLKLSKKDIMILYNLDLNSRNSLNKISKDVKISPQLLNYKLKKFEEEQLIESHNTIIDYSRLGYISFIVCFKVNYVNDTIFKKLIKTFLKNPNTLSVIECGGRWDLIVKFIAKNSSAFNKEFKNILYENSKQLRNYDVLTIVVRHDYNRSYLINKKHDNNIDKIIGGDRNIYNLTDREKNILSLIIDDSRKSALTISQELNIHPKTVINDIKNLISNKIISGFRSQIDPTKYGFERNLVLIRYHNLSEDREISLINFCKNNQNIIRATKTFGLWDLLIEVETKNSTKFRNIFMELREHYEDIIHEIETLQIFKKHKDLTGPKYIE